MRSTGTPATRGSIGIARQRYRRKRHPGEADAGEHRERITGEAAPDALAPAIPEDRIAVMSQGVISQLGTPEQIYREPASAYVFDFIGRANSMSGTVRSLRGARGAGIAGYGPTVQT